MTELDDSQRLAGDVSINLYYSKRLKDDGVTKFDDYSLRRVKVL